MCLISFFYHIMGLNEGVGLISPLNGGTWIGGQYLTCLGTFWGHVWNMFWGFGGRLAGHVGRMFTDVGTS